MDFKRCSDKRKDLQIVVEENGRKFRIINAGRENINTVRVDSCLIDDKRQRCDFLFEIGKSCYCVVYLELKGSDVEHAFKQLVATMGYLSTRHRVSTKICHIVASRVPRAGPKVQTLQLNMARKHRALLYVGTHEVKINIGHVPYKPHSR
jgi:hypothetical protein